MEFTFAELLRGYRQRASLDQIGLATALQVHTNTISGWERGRCRPRYREIVLRLAAELMLTPAETDQLLHSADFPTAHSPLPLLYPCYQLRSPVADFVGRAHEIERLISVLHTALTRGHAAVCGVQGMGGIGKTELAYAVAQHACAAFPDAQLFLHLQGSSSHPLPTEQALRRVIHTLAPDLRLPEDGESLEQHYRTVLHGRRVLILADDAQTAQQMLPLLPPPGCALLVTSRARFTLPGMHTINLEQLTETEAIVLLRTICDRLSLADAQMLARACGYLPLALRISSSIVRNDPALNVADYLAKLAGERWRLAQLRDPDDPRLDVETSLRLSYAQLDDGIQHVFRQLGVFGSDFAMELAQAVMPADVATDVEAALRHLLRRNLLMYDSERARWRLHDLVRDLARGELKARSEWEAAMWRYAQAAVRIAQTIKTHYENGGADVLAALGRFDAERPHIDAAQTWIAKHAGTPAGDALVVQVALATAYARRLRYPLRRVCIPQLEDACAAARRLEDRQSEARLLQLLGHVHYSLGETAQPLRIFKQALIAAQDTGDRRLEGRILSNMGSTYAHLGNDLLAIPTFEQALAIAQDAGDRRLEANILSNLGLAWVSLGDVRRALPYHVQALAIVRALGDQQSESITLNCLGFDYICAGEAEQAIPVLEQARTIAQALGDRRLEGGVLGNLGRAYLELGDVQRANELGGMALALAQEIGDQHSVGIILTTLGRVYTALHAPAQANATFERAHAILHTIGDRNAEAECCWYFGLFLIDQGDHAQALSLLHAALAYEQEIGHALAGEHAALLEQLESRVELHNSVNA